MKIDIIMKKDRIGVEAYAQYDEDNRLVVDVTFKSSSTAGNFVTGRSTDGPGSWKTLDGKRLKDML